MQKALIKARDDQISHIIDVMARCARSGQHGDPSGLEEGCVSGRRFELNSYPFDKYLLSAYCEPGNVLGAVYMVVNKSAHTPAFLHLHPTY